MTPKQRWTGGPPAKNLTGQRFGKLVAIRPGEKRKKQSTWICVCDCGKESNPMATSLLYGLTKSCGCGVHPKTHGLTNTPEHKIWKSMKARCNNPKSPFFKYYGGRGIRVCERWATSFEAFLADMGNRPDPNLSIDRINNDGNYEPGNCRWATMKEQANNTRRSLKYRTGPTRAAAWRDAAERMK